MLKIVNDQAMPEPIVIPTPSLQWNHLLGGGLWTDRIHTFWGNSGGGKSTMMLKTMAIAQAMGFTPVIIDSEGTMTREYMAKCGIDNSDKVYFPHANFLEDIEKEVLPMMREPDSKYVFLFDSINGIIKQQFYDKDDKGGGMALYARSQNELAMKLSGHLNPNHLILFVCQQTVDLSGTMAMTVGKYGNAVEHFSTNIIKIFASGSQKTMDRNDDGTIIAHDVLWTITKSKQAPIRGTTGSYKFSPATAGIDNTEEMIDIAGLYGIIDASKKGWYTYKGQSMRKSELAELLSDADEQQMILDTISGMNR